MQRPATLAIGLATAFLELLSMPIVSTDLLPPVAPQIPYSHMEHGVERPDPWHWLREKENPQVIAHLEAENRYTAAIMAQAGDLQECLYRELVGRIEEDDHSAPYFKGDFEYQSRIERGDNYRRYYRRPRDGSGPWQLYFDANARAESKPYFDLGIFEVSPDGNWLAYAEDLDGDEVYTLHFRDLRTGEDLPATILAVGGNGEWTGDSTGFVYVVEDKTRRPYRLIHYRLGADPASATVIYEEADPTFYLGIERSQDGLYLFAVSASKETTEVAYAPAAEPGRLSVLYPRRHGIRYFLEHHLGRWLVHSNENAPDFQLLAVPVDRPDLAEASVLWAPREHVRLQGFMPLRDFIVFWESERGLDFIRILQLEDGTEHRLSMPDPVYTLEDGHNEEFETEYLDFSYSSPIRPSVTWRYHLGERTRTIIDQSIVPAGHDPDAYVAYRREAVAADGATIPVTIAHRKDLRLDGNNRAFLYAYGAYADTIDPGFQRSWLTWLQRDFVVAIAHVRGGGLLGEAWYQQGKLGNKQNSFSDFIACAEKLIADGYTAPDRLAIQGESAGGLLIGAVLNQRPDLFRVAVAGVPFVDTLNTMLDESLPLTTFEYEEWGDPREPAAFQTILAYSPYDNVRAQAYPAILATAGLNDTRVHYWEAAKWVAKLRSLNTSSLPVLLKTSMEAGHAGASGRYDYLRDIALEQAFILKFLP